MREQSLQPPAKEERCTTVSSLTGRQEGGAHPKEDDDLWLDLYVMLSRATRLQDLLLMRAPDLSFFAKGPPKTLRTQLAKFASRTNACRRQAEKIAQELGLAAFVRPE